MGLNGPPSDPRRQKDSPQRSIYVLASSTLALTGCVLSFAFRSMRAQAQDFLPVDARSARSADYGAESFSLKIAVADLALIEDVLQDAEGDPDLRDPRLTEILESLEEPVPTGTPVPPTPTHTPAAVSIPLSIPSPSSTPIPWSTPIPSATPIPPTSTDTPLSPTPSATLPPTATPTPACMAGSLDLPLSMDTTVKEQDPDKNLGFSNKLDVRLHNDAEKGKWGLLRFMLGAVPSECQVTSATLSLRQTEDGEFMIGVYRITHDWAEGSVTWNTLPSLDPSPWATFSADIEGDRFVDLTSLVSGWQRGDFPNYGLLMRSTGGEGEAKFESREGRHPPVLTIEYRP